MDDGQEEEDVFEDKMSSVCGVVATWDSSKVSLWVRFPPDANKFLIMSVRFDSRAKSPVHFEREQHRLFPTDKIVHSPTHESPKNLHIRTKPWRTIEL